MKTEPVQSPLDPRTQPPTPCSWDRVITPGCAGGPPGGWRAPRASQHRVRPPHPGRSCCKCSGPCCPGCGRRVPAGSRWVPSGAAPNQGSQHPLHVEPTWAQAPSSLGDIRPHRRTCSTGGVRWPFFRGHPESTLRCSKSVQGAVHWEMLSDRCSEGPGPTVVLAPSHGANAADFRPLPALGPRTDVGWLHALEARADLSGL